MSEDLNTIKFADNTLSTVRTMPDVTGQNLQINNGPDNNNMFCMSFEHNAGDPFYFERSSSLGSYYIPQKITSTYFSSGREGTIVNNNFDVDYSLSQIYADADVLGKAAVKQISFKGGEAVISYDLAQNFPNPFNPITTIKFQIPEDGMVSLKIYDILGKEITTLTNEQKTVGKYELRFDASNLASGVYIYRIQVNDFVSVKKMILLR